ncbi:MAG: type II toxin-antitoxin system prevent-host-death family antitoxin [Terracidiphilus sp.]|jgi:prevent-host-death family protein
MRTSLRAHTKESGKPSRETAGKERWKLEDAKARFSEVVRLAGTAGPQWVTVRGREAAVILAPEQYRQLLPKPMGHVGLSRFLQGLDLGKIEVYREHDAGREVDL